MQAHLLGKIATRVTVVVAALFIENSLFAQTPLLYTTLDGASAVATPANGTGSGSSVVTTPAGDFVAGKIGNGIQIDAAGEYVRFQQTNGTTRNVNLAAGTVDFWFRPAFANSDGVSHRIFGIGTSNQPGSIALYKRTSTFGNDLYVQVISASGGFQTSTVAATQYSWTAGQWVQLRVTWDGAVASGVPNAHLYIDGTERTYSSRSTGPFSMPAESASQYIYIGSISTTETNIARGVLDEFRIFSGALPPSGTPPPPNDTTPPSVPAGLAAVPVGPTSISLSWNASTDNVAVAGYRVFRQGNLAGSPAGTSFTDQNLQPGTTYTYNVAAFDAAGNTSAQSSPVSATTATQPDTTPPSVSITSPAMNATVSGTVTVTANASDNVAVAGVQFTVDGNNSGAEVTQPPYSLAWSSTAVANGAHTLRAVARDTSNNVATSAAVTVNVANSASSPTPALAYSFNEPGGAAVADSSGNNNSGTAVGATVVPGKNGNARSFNGSSQYITIPESASLGIRPQQTGLTVSMWLKLTGSQVGTVLCTGSGAGYNMLFPTTSSLRVADNAGHFFTLNFTFAQNTWYHVAVTVASGSSPTESYYINGNLAASGTSTTWASSTGWGTAFIASNGATPRFAGVLDDLRIYGRALSQNEIRTDMNTAVSPGTAPGDTTPPVVAIATPMPGSSLSAISTIIATATDNAGVAGVQFLVDGAAAGPEDTTAPYSLALDTTALPDGSHTISARARDTSGNLATSAAASYTVNNSSRPDIVFILTDDERYDLMGFMPLTTALLSNETVKFDNALVTTSDCCPSRSSILTGLYSHNTGVLQDYAPNGGATVFSGNSTIATWLRSTGYRTGIFGKYLNQYYNVAPAMPPGWDEFNVFVKNTITNNDGDYYHNYQLNQNGTIVAYGNTAADYSTDMLAAKVVQMINTTPAGRPLFVYFTPYGPHDPAVPATQDAGKFSSFAVPRPPSYNEADVSDKPAWLRNMPLLTQSQINSADAFARSQLETLQSVDRAVSSVITALQQTGRWHKTLLIFMSDNGLFWGEHRMWNTKFVGYEESIRVPLWVRAPGLAARHDPKIVANIDLAPTIAQWAGVIPPSKVNGMSFVNLLSNPNAAWRSEILIEYLGPTINSSMAFQAVRTSRYFYAEYKSGDRELYDLAQDPFQLTNVINDPAYAQQIPVLRNLLTNLKAQ
jgi:arylsulfatase A-like enzyme/chitodextrinase